MRGRMGWVSVAVLMTALMAPPAGAAPCAAVPVVDDRCEVWSATYDHPGHATTGIDIPFGSATSATGDTIYVTGQSWDDASNHYDVATVAYDVATGTQRWLSRYAGPEGRHDIPETVVVSPDGATLYVAASQGMNPVGEQADLAVIALNAATGATRWSVVYDGGGEGAAAGEDVGTTDDVVNGIAISPDGAYVYVIGKSGAQHENMDYATVAVRTVDGTIAWASRYSSIPGNAEDIGISVVVAPDGRAVYVTGASYGVAGTTMAYAAGDRPDAGEVLWTTKRTTAMGYWLSIAPDGSTVYVSGARLTGAPARLGPGWDVDVAALSTTDGKLLWETSFTGTSPGIDVPYAHVLSPDGLQLVVGGVATGAMELDQDSFIAAVDTRDGSTDWEHRDAIPGHRAEGIGAIAYAPDSNRVYASGWNSNGETGTQTTIAYNAADGTPAWTARYVPDGVSAAFPASLVVAPDGKRVIVAGRLDHREPVAVEANGADYLVLAYDR